VVELGEWYAAQRKTNTCPRCQHMLRAIRYPVTDRPGLAAESSRERLRYVMAWLCDNESCDFWEPIDES
jgi:hypothetical protein